MVWLPGTPLTYFNDWVVQVIFLGLKFWPKVNFFGSMKYAGIFLGCEKNRGIFWVAKKGLRDILRYVRKVVIFLGRQILKLGYFWV